MIDPDEDFLADMPTIDTPALVFEVAMRSLQWTQEWLREEICAHHPEERGGELLTDLERNQTLGRAHLRALFMAAGGGQL